MKRRDYGYEAYIRLSGILEDVSLEFTHPFDDEELLRASRTLISVVKRYLPETRGTEEFLRFQKIFEKYKSLNIVWKIFPLKSRKIREELCEYGKAVAEMAIIEWDSIACPWKDYGKTRTLKSKKMVKYSENVPPEEYPKEIKIFPKHSPLISKLREDLSALKLLLADDEHVTRIRRRLYKMIDRLASLCNSLYAEGLCREEIGRILLKNEEMRKFLQDKPADEKISRVGVNVPKLLRNYLAEIEEFLDNLETE